MARAERTRALIELLRARGLDAFFVTHLPDIRYLSGFTGTSASCLVSSRGCLFFTDFRYALQARREAAGFLHVTVSAGDAFSELAARAGEMGLRRIGFEADVLPYGAYRRLRSALLRSARLIPSPSLAGKLRMVKDRGELRLLRRLAKMTDAVLEACRREIKKGVTEWDIARCLERLAYEAGARGLSFDPIVASGRAGAMPHHRTSRRRLKERAPLIVDFGLSLGGYNSDLTRTFYLGRVTRRYRDIYGVVYEAQRIALKHVRPGARAAEVDAAARDFISSRGYGSGFGHGLGHGIGLEVHEAPRLREGGRETLEAGEVVTVEPGVYIEGWGGVRIEDMVLVTGRGCVPLTSSARELEDNLL